MTELSVARPRITARRWAGRDSLWVPDKSKPSGLAPLTGLFTFMPREQAHESFNKKPLPLCGKGLDL